MLTISMTRLLEQAIAKLRQLPPESQNEIAEVVEGLANDPRRDYTPEQTEKIERGLAQADAGDFVPEEQVAAFFAQYRNA